MVQVFRYGFSAPISGTCVIGIRLEVAHMRSNWQSNFEGRPHIACQPIGRHFLFQYVKYHMSVSICSSSNQKLGKGNLGAGQLIWVCSSSP